MLDELNKFLRKLKQFCCNLAMHKKIKSYLEMLTSYGNQLKYEYVVKAGFEKGMVIK